MTLTRTSPAVARRVAELEDLLGPLDDPVNPAGREALLTADEAWVVLGEAERRLDGFGLGAEIVPVRHGGRFERVDVLGRVLRPVFRRDPALGFADAVLCFIAASMVWLDGTEEQCRLAAGLLLGGERMTLVRREESHANDLTREELVLTGGPDGLLLQGTKNAIGNADRARGLVVMARHEGEQGHGGYTALLLDRTKLDEYCLEELPRYPTVGMRGCWFGGLEFTDCPVPAGAVVGAPGRAVEIGLRCSLLVRGVVVSAQIASGDTMLRTAARFVDRHRDIPRQGVNSGHETTALAGTLLDLMVGDCLALAACRAVHLIPEDAGVIAAAAAYVVPKLLAEAAENLTVVLGNAQYATSGPYGMFQKHLRDLPVTTLGHTGSAGRQATLVANLPRFAATSWFRSPEPDPALFEIDGPLPPLDLSRVKVVGESDPLAAALLGCARMLGRYLPPNADRRQIALLRTLVDLFVSELDELRSTCARLGEQGKSALLTPQGYAQADRFALLCAAAAALGVWRGQQGCAASADSDPFLADPRWAIGALSRIGQRLNLLLPEGADANEQWALDEVFRRYRGNLSYDIYATRQAG
jgi:alkylation response protein AidB-like acyl-CoA dehydrogenase